METSITFRVNGERRQLVVATNYTLLRVLRESLGLTGTKECCSLGECGSCTVLLDGRAVCSCLVLGVEADGADVLTIEGLAKHDKLDALQSAFVERGAVQCGFCIPGMIISAKYLLSRNPRPTVEDVKEGLCGNLCRCAGYSRIIEAVIAAATSST